jgi:hypothetical protein
MNQDFLLPATPANARRLLLFRRNTPIDVDDPLDALAMQDRLAESAFDELVCPYDPVAYTIAQFLLDCGLRGVIQADYHPEITPLRILHIVQQVRSESVMVITERRRVWAMASMALHIKVEMASALIALEDASRDTVVIYDANYSPTFQFNPRLRHWLREFPHFLIFDQRRGFERLMHWTLWARWLCPGMPHPLAPRLVSDVPEVWRKLPLAAFAVFYNVCLFPHLITEPSIVAALEDDYVEEQVKYHTSLFTLA